MQVKRTIQLLTFELGRNSIGKAYIQIIFQVHCSILYLDFLTDFCYWSKNKIEIIYNCTVSHWSSTPSSWQCSMTPPPQKLLIYHHLPLTHALNSSQQPPLTSDTINSSQYCVAGRIRWWLVFRLLITLSWWNYQGLRLVLAVSYK